MVAKRMKIAGCHCGISKPLQSGLSFVLVETSNKNVIKIK